MPDIRPPAQSSALVLNATYEPLGVVSVRRATILVLSAKAVCIADGEGILHSEHTAMAVPLVLTIPHRQGLAIALDYLSRVHFPDPSDEIHGGSPVQRPHDEG